MNNILLEGITVPKAKLTHEYEIYIGNLLRMEAVSKFIENFQDF